MPSGDHHRAGRAGLRGARTSVRYGQVDATTWRPGKEVGPKWPQEPHIERKWTEPENGPAAMSCCARPGATGRSYRTTGASELDRQSRQPCQVSGRRECQEVGRYGQCSPSLHHRGPRHRDNGVDAKLVLADFGMEPGGGRPPLSEAGSRRVRYSSALSEIITCPSLCHALRDGMSDVSKQRLRLLVPASGYSDVGNRGGRLPLQ